MPPGKRAPLRIEQGESCRFRIILSGGIIIKGNKTCAFVHTDADLGLKYMMLRSWIRGARLIDEEQRDAPPAPDTP
jgi:hypothetical protein